MKLSIISFTQSGINLSEKITKRLDEIEYTLFTKCSSYEKGEKQIAFVDKGVSEWAKEQFAEKNALIFIGACGIAIRAIAPHITDKLHDSPVLVMDEKGQYVIPILSGHVGGANELAVFFAEKTGAVPVITTATDINNKFAVDIFAKKNGLSILNKDGIARVSSKVLAGKNITMSIETGHFRKEGKVPNGIELIEYPPLQEADVVITSENKEFNTAIFLRTKEYGIGMGCRKGKESEKIEEFIKKSLDEAGVSLMQIYGLASIDVKKEEPGLLSWSKKTNIPFTTYTAEELKKVEGAFHKSVFVKEQVGVDNVCERAALKLCEPEGSLVYERHSEDGMTIAIAKREWRVNFDET